MMETEPFDGIRTEPIEILLYLIVVLVFCYEYGRLHISLQHQQQPNQDGISGLGHVGEDEDATIGTSPERLLLFETV
jgi:hypothetical protein